MSFEYVSNNICLPLTIKFPGEFNISNALASMQTVLDSGELAYTPEEEAALRDKRIAFLHLFFENGDFGFYHSHLYGTHEKQAFYYAENGDTDKALEHLSLAAEHAVKFITSNDEDSTSLVFRGKNYGCWSTDSPENDAACLLEKMEESVFDNIRNREEFTEIKYKLSKFAGEWKV